MHMHFTCIFLSFLGLSAVWSVSVSGCFYRRCPVAVLSKVVGWRELIPQTRRMQERAAAGWRTFDSASIE